MNRKLTAILIASLFLSGVAAMPATVSAETNDCGTFGSLVGCDTASDMGVVDQLSFVGEVVNGAVTTATEKASMKSGIASTDSASNQADYVQKEFNRNSDKWVSWANNRLSQTTHTSETIAIDLVFNTAENSETRHLEVSFDSDGNVSSAQIVETTSATTEYTIELQPLLTQNADEEYDELYYDYVSSGEDLDSSYKASHSRYVCDLQTSGFGYSLSEQYSVVDTACF